MLDAERYQRAKAIFFEACEQPRGRRDEFVERACAGDFQLRAAVLELLAQDDDPLSIVAAGSLRQQLEELADSSAGSGDGDAPTRLDADLRATPARIGRYRILSRLGAGGMGVVYLAEQDNPRRQVALKVIASGQATRQALRRFEHEAQILGRLHHPGIAAVYEAGMHDSGDGAQPYFAMELVRGLPLLRHCQHTRLGRRARLELFIAICDAVQHAHQHGVIHRDLKPANILVEGRDGETERRPDEADADKPTSHRSTSSLRLSVSPSLPQIKILDFGVARLIDSDVQATTMHTAADQLIGTVAYMSPEQMSGDPAAIDTRSDIFALGVILFELLAERLPHQVEGQTIPEMIRTISESEPSSLSAIDRSLRGDLDTIVGKAMERDKTRRYATASELAADLRRHLDDQPIHARPPSAAYQMRKFARRNKALVGGAAAVFLALVGGIIATTWQARQAIAARDEQVELRQSADANAARATRAAERASTVVDVLRQMLGTANPHDDKGRDYTVRQMLDDFAAGGGEALRSEPDVRATILLAVGDAYLSLGELRSAEPRLREALEIRRKLTRETASEDDALVVAILEMGWLKHDMGDYLAAETFMREGMQVAARLQGDAAPLRLARAQAALGDVLMHLGRLEESEALLTQAIRSMRALDVGEAITPALTALAMTLEERGRLAEAVPLLREAITLDSVEAAPPSHAATTSIGNLGLLLMQLGQYQESERLLRQALELNRQRVGESHARVAQGWNNLGLVLDALSRLAEAEECFRRAVSIHRARTELDRQNLSTMLQNLGINLANQSRVEEAIPLLEESIALTLADESAPPADLALTRGVLAELLWLNGRRPEGEGLALEALEGLRRLLGEDHPSTVVAAMRLGRMWMRSGRAAAADPLLQSAFDHMIVEPGPAHRDTVQAASFLGELRMMQGRFADAEHCMAAVMETAIQTLGHAHPATSRNLALLAQAYGRQGKLAQADALVARQIEWMRTVATPDDIDLADTIASLAISYHKQSKWAQAEPLLREARAIAQANDSPQPMTAQMDWRLGDALAHLGRFDEAEPMLLDGFARLASDAHVEVAERREACAAVVHLYEQTANAQALAAWQLTLQGLAASSSTQPDGR